jgi:uroporphyrinogen-III synthase
LKILLTHQQGRLEGLATELLALGHVVEHLPLIQTKPLFNPNLKLLLNSDWWIFTSVSAVEAANTLKVFDLPIPKIAALGDATTRALTNLGLSVALTASKATAAGLAHSLLEFSGVMTWLRGADALPDLRQVLQVKQPPVRELIIYETLQLPFPTIQADALVLCSPSAVQIIPDKLGSQVHCVALGNSTAAAITQRGWHAFVAQEPTVAGIIQIFKGFL